MRISGSQSNQVTVVRVKKGYHLTRSGHIVNGRSSRPSITNEAVDDLGIKAKRAVIVGLKASDVILRLN